MSLQEAWEFDIAFDTATGHVTRVAARDNEKYATYIKAQNQATDASQATVEMLGIWLMN